MANLPESLIVPTVHWLCIMHLSMSNWKRVEAVVGTLIIAKSRRCGLVMFLTLELISSML